MNKQKTRLNRSVLLRFIKATFMTGLLPSLILMFSFQTARAGSATWNLNPTTNDWNTATNWTPATVPNGPSDIATFGSSSQTSLSVSAATEVSQIVFDPGASAFTIAPKVSDQVNVLTISGSGITNNSGITQNLATNANGFKTGEIHFTNSASAGSGVLIANHGNPIAGLSALTQFFDNATAGSATVVNEGVSVNASGSGATFFNDNSNAGNGTFINVNNPEGGAGYIIFNGNSSAANGTFINDSTISFYDTSSAGNGVFSGGVSNGGFIEFALDATAANGIFTCAGDRTNFGRGVIFFDGNSDHATVTVEAGAVSGGLGGAIQFDQGTAANGNFTLNGASISGAGGGTVAFVFGAAGGEAIFDLGGGTVSGAGGASMICSDEGSQFFPNAQNATLRVHGGTNGGDGADLEFWDRSSGGAARIEIFGNGRLDISSRRDHPFITVGSIEGDGAVFLGRNILETGGNNRNTTFSGLIQDGGVGNGQGGSIIKTGKGLLNLTGANTYKGTTTVNQGGLGISNSSGSATGPGAVTVNTGLIGGGGTMAGTLTIGTGNGTGAFLAPALGKKKQKLLVIQSALTLKSDATYTCTFKGIENGVRNDEVIANGVTISGTGFSLQATTQTALPIGAQLLVLSNTSAAPIAGTFNNLADGATITVGSNTFQANYEGGDGNDLTLTVVP